MIRSAPLYGYGRAGNVIFAGEGKDQFFIEGVVIAALTVGTNDSCLMPSDSNDIIITIFYKYWNATSLESILLD